MIQVVEKITFVIDKIFEVSFPKSEYQVHEKTVKVSYFIIQWNSTHSGIFEILGDDLDRK